MEGTLADLQTVLQRKLQQKLKIEGEIAALMKAVQIMDEEDRVASSAPANTSPGVSIGTGGTSGGASTPGRWP